MCKAWNAFNGWRKKYWLGRIIIMLAIFSCPIYERLRGDWIITDLVAIACKGIFATSIPQSENALCRYYKFDEKTRLRKLIFTYADLNHDGRLDNRELDILRSKSVNTGLITGNPLHTDYRKTADAAKKLKLVSPLYSARKERMKAFYAAHMENENFYRPLKAEVFDILDRINGWNIKFTPKQLEMIHNTYPDKNLTDGSFIPDYMKWNTWKCGIYGFLGGLIIPFTSIFNSITWFFLAMFIAVLTALKYEKNTKLAAITASIMFTLLIFNINVFSGTCGVFIRYGFSYPFIQSKLFFYLSYTISATALAAVAGIVGAKLECCIKETPRAVYVILAMTGILFLVRNTKVSICFADWWFDGIGNYLGQEAYLKFGYLNEYVVIGILFLLAGIKPVYKVSTQKTRRISGS